MLNTIAECNKEIRRIDSELARLNLERRHVHEVMNMLISQSSQSIPAWTRKDQILEVIRQNPGIDGKSVRKALPDYYTPRQITFSMSDMRKKGLLENRGTHGQGARWYIKESNDQ
jgi:hypothetical protein